MRISTRHLAHLLLLALLLAACGRGGLARMLADPSPTTPATPAANTPAAVAPATDLPTVTVYHSPACNCCGNWISYMQAEGFPVEVEEVTDPALVKREYAIPAALYSCHTAVVDGYILEGHVPAADIRRLLDERPAVRGIAVPGMPIGAPGMETEGVAPQPYDVLTFDAAGNTTVWAEYRP